jgi:Ulp1 family protease
MINVLSLVYFEIFKFLTNRNFESKECNGEEAFKHSLKERNKEGNSFHLNISMFKEFIEVSDSEGEKYCTKWCGQDKFVQGENDDCIMLVWPFKEEESEEFAGATILNNHAKNLKIGSMYNDEMLNFGISYFSKWLCPSKELRSKTFIYSSLFYTKLIEPPSAESGIRRLDLHGRFLNGKKNI